MSTTSVRAYLVTLCVLSVSLLISLPATALDGEIEMVEETSTPRMLSVEGFVDAYYSYDFGDPNDNVKPLLFNYNRHNEFSINVAMLSVGYEQDRVRGRIGLMAGTYSEYNYAAELPQVRPIYEAWGGYELFENVWWDAGLFPSHIGWESVHSTSNITLTRSLAAANSPFFLAGTRLYWTPSDTLTLGLTLANGWQNVAETNDSKGIGTQVTWSPSDVFTLNSSTWVSDEIAAGSRLRLFHDLYGVVNLGRASFIAGLDTGMQRTPDGAEKEWDIWWTAAALARVNLTNVVATGARVEYFHDPGQVIIVTGNPNGIRTLGASLNLDFALAESAVFRLEGRMFRDARELYMLGKNPSQTNIAATAALTLAFDHLLDLTPSASEE